MSHLPFWDAGLTPQMVKMAEEKLKETPKRRKEALEEFKRLIHDEPGFAPYADDSFLLRFLRVKKFDVKRAFKTFKNYFAYKSKYSGQITDLTPTDVKHILEKNKLLVSPKRSLNGEGVSIILLGSYDLESSSPEQYLSAVLVCAEIAIEMEASQVCGKVVVLDLKGLTLSRISQYCTTKMMSLCIKGVQECWPYRLKAFHVVNEPYFVGFTYRIIKSMISKKLSDRVHFHGSDLDSLHRSVSRECLPEQLGGMLGTKDFLDFRSNILIRQPLMEKINKYVYKGR